jgi:hypothetical protein
MSIGHLAAYTFYFAWRKEQEQQKKVAYKVLAI